MMGTGFHGFVPFCGDLSKLMTADPQTGADLLASPEAQANTPVSTRLDEYEKRQHELWRLTFFLLFVITIAFAWFSWDTLRSTRFRLEALPFGLVALVGLLGVYVWKKTQEIAELKGMVRGLDQKDSAPPSDRQLEHLFQMISKSQQGFRDLIDSFDDILVALSLDGEIRAVNRSFADFVGQPFQEIIGLSLTQFLDEEHGISEETLKRGMSRFLERRFWSGVVHIRLKKTGATFFFDCVAHAMVRDDKVHGLTVLARNITPSAAVKRGSPNSLRLFRRASISSLPRIRSWK